MKSIPQRKCIACGAYQEKSGLIKVVRVSENTYELDEGKKKNGRGAYFCKNRTCLLDTIKKRCLDKAFRERVPGEFYESLQELAQELL